MGGGRRGDLLVRLRVLVPEKLTTEQREVFERLRATGRFELALILAIVYLRFGNRLFGTAPLAAQAWLAVLPLAVAMVGLEEGRKAWVRRRAARDQWSGRTRAECRQLR